MSPKRSETRLRLAACLGAAALLCIAGCGSDDDADVPDGGVARDAASDAGAMDPSDAGADDPRDGGSGSMSCGDCGVPTECAEPSCDPMTGLCDPGYLVMDLADDMAGDCLTLACTGTATAAQYVPDDDDLPAEPTDPDAPCGVAACAAGAPTTATASVGTACRGQPGFCDGTDTSMDSCKRCVDTGADPREIDVGCDRVRSFCYIDAVTLTRGGCFPFSDWDDQWGAATIGTDGVTAANLGTAVANVRSDVTINSGKYYWEIDVVQADPADNGGGVGVMDVLMPEDAAYIGAGATGLSFGYGGLQTYRSGWPNISFPSGRPPVGSYARTGMTYMFAVDMDSGELWVGNAGVWYNGGDPERGSSPAAVGLPDRIRAGVTIFEGDTVFRANFMGPFRHPVPWGYRPGLF